MFGDEFASETARILRVCCGPRCGAEGEHRRIYAAVETFAAEQNRQRADDALAVRPAICQGYCGMGVTVVTPDSEWIKIRAASEVRDKISTLEDNKTCPQ